MKLSIVHLVVVAMVARFSLKDRSSYCYIHASPLDERLLVISLSFSNHRMIGLSVVSCLLVYLFF